MSFLTVEVLISFRLAFDTLDFYTEKDVHESLEHWHLLWCNLALAASVRFCKQIQQQSSSARTTLPCARMLFSKVLKEEKAQDLIVPWIIFFALACAVRADRTVLSFKLT